jgi:CRISPR-associated protein Csx10
MIYVTLTVDFEHYWHCGSGQAGEGDIDLMPRTEDCGLPFVPGRTLLGRLKWAARELGWPETEIIGFFSKGDAALDHFKRLHIEHATMQDEFAKEVRAHYQKHRHIPPEVTALFREIASTAMQNGVALDKSLRRVRYAVPVKLEAEVELLDEADYEKFRACAEAVRAIGKGKHDGFGWSRIEVEDPPRITSVHTDQDSKSNKAEEKNAVTRFFDVTLTLLDDVVFSASSATVGGHETLDYAPGSALMGAAARRIFDEGKRETEGALDLAKGRISFGNGYPLGGLGAGLPMPLSLHYEKGQAWVSGGAIHSDKVTNLAYVLYADSSLNGKQPVQLRTGYLCEHSGTYIHTETTHSLRTAISTDLTHYETAAEEELFGYAAIVKGTRLRSRIEINHKDTTEAGKLAQVLVETFGGKIIRLGRSKGAEFGRARCAIEEVSDDTSCAEIKGVCIVLAESDLALLDGNGFPRFEPSAADLGLPADWKLVREKTFLRTRRYALWNAKRGGSDLERQVISKGSVFVFSGSGTATPDKVKTRIGLGQGEGLGRLRVQPVFLASEQPWFAKPPEQTKEATKPSSELLIPKPKFGNAEFTTWVLDRHNEQTLDVRAYKMAVDWTKSWQKHPTKVHTSQWMRLDEAARLSANVEDLINRLDTLFGHGRRAKEKWCRLDRRTGKSLADAVLASLEKGNDDRLTLATFRAAVHRMPANART